MIGWVAGTGALWVGRVVIVLALLFALACAWWLLGEAIWRRVLPSRWKARYLKPAYRGTQVATPLGLVVMIVLGGPLGWADIPRIVRRKRIKEDDKRLAELEWKWYREGKGPRPSSAEPGGVL